MDGDFAIHRSLVQTVLPRIRFLFIGSWFCSTLPSDAASRRRPCASLALHLHQVVQGTFTPKLSNMLGTRWHAHVFVGMSAKAQVCPSCPRRRGHATHRHPRCKLLEGSGLRLFQRYWGKMLRARGRRVDRMNRILRDAIQHGAKCGGLAAGFGSHAPPVAHRVPRPESCTVQDRAGHGFVSHSPPVAHRVPGLVEFLRRFCGPQFCTGQNGTGPRVAHRVPGAAGLPWRFCTGQNGTGPAAGGMSRTRRVDRIATEPGSRRARRTSGRKGPSIIIGAAVPSGPRIALTRAPRLRCDAMRCEAGRRSTRSLRPCRHFPSSIPQRVGSMASAQRW
jgi:hypothetical protein